MAWNDMSRMQVLERPKEYAQEQIDRGALHVLAFPKDKYDEIDKQYREAHNGAKLPLSEARTTYGMQARELVQMGQPGEGWVGNYKVGDMLDITGSEKPECITYKEYLESYVPVESTGRDVRTPQPVEGFVPIMDKELYMEKIEAKGAMRVVPDLRGYYDVVQVPENISFLDEKGQQQNVPKGDFIGRPMMGPSTYSPEVISYDKMMNEIGIIRSSGQDVMTYGQDKSAGMPGRIHGEPQPGRIYGEPGGNRGRELPELPDKEIDPIVQLGDGREY